MPINLNGRSCTKLLDFSPEEIHYLLDLARDLKRAKYAGAEQRSLRAKNIVLLFAKDSTRTRCAFEVAAMDQGAGVSYLGASGSQMGKKESIADTARVLGRMYDGIEYRGAGQELVEELAKYAGVPVWNGLTNEFHPTQVLADFLTIKEQRGSLKGLKLAFIGDGQNNVANSLLVGAAKMGLNFRLIAPKELQSNAKLVQQCQAIAQQTGASIMLTDELKRGTDAADVIYTDVWVSMGEAEAVWNQRIELLQAYQVTKNVMANAKADAIFMHCLPAFHNTQTIIGAQIAQKFGLREMEVTDEVFESSASVVFDQAENRLHTIKALLIATIGR